MDFAELRSSIFEGEEEATIEETPLRDQLRRPLVGFPLMLGIGALGLWGFDKFSQDGKLLENANVETFIVFRNITPLLVDLTNPSPSIGWNCEERASFFERDEPDVIL